jgi:hypothetical protein
LIIASNLAWSTGLLGICDKTFTPDGSMKLPSKKQPLIAHP